MWDCSRRKTLRSITAQTCDLLSLQLPGTVVVREGWRNGFGTALRLGFAKATNDLIWVVPLDLPYSLSVRKEAPIATRASVYAAVTRERHFRTIINDSGTRCCDERAGPLLLATFGSFSDDHTCASSNSRDRVQQAICGRQQDMAVTAL
jgi:hypothetical protein